jgi:hypothetical protein
MGSPPVFGELMAAPDYPQPVRKSTGRSAVCSGAIREMSRLFDRAIFYDS